jgi:hypothetical protein
MRSIAAALASSALAIGCGGGGGDTSTPPVDSIAAEDAAASSSVVALMNWAIGQVNDKTSDVTEPRPIQGMTPATTDADEPMVI